MLAQIKLVTSMTHITEGISPNLSHLNHSLTYHSLSTNNVQKWRRG